MGRSGKVWPEEDELVHRVRAAQGGEPGALEALLARLRPSFVAYFAPIMGRDDAEDAAQVAVLSILRTVSGINPERALGYVLAVASHRVANARRRQACAAQRFLPLEFAEGVEWPVGADWETEYHELARAGRASPRCRLSAAHPHQALDMKVPANLYRRSPRVYRGLEELTYPYHDATVPVTRCGRICFQGRKVSLSQVFAGQNVGVTQVGERVWLVTFMQYDLGYFDDEAARVQPIDYPFGSKVLPMSPE